MNQGGLEHDVKDAFEENGVGFDLSCPGDARKDSMVLAVLRHPIKSFLCMSGSYFERKESPAYLR